MAGNIILVGPMGAGKTTIGRLLAKALERRFFDSDAEIEKRTGASITWIFDLEGEAGFRRRETEMLERLLAWSDIVLATGGGAVLSPHNRELMSTSGRVVYLRATLEQQLRRTRLSKNRPLLQDADPVEKLKQLSIIREPLYQEISDLQVDTHVGSPHVVVNRIIEQLER